MTDWSIIQSFYGDRQDKMLGHLILKIQERGDMDKNYEENEACEIFWTTCKEALQTKYKVFDAGLSGCVDPFRPIISYLEQERSKL